MLDNLIKIYALILGLCFGSFANVAVYRIPRNESLLSPPSRCPKCGRRLAITDLIPVVSWLLLRGKCKYCGEKIAIRYPVTESMCALLFFGMACYTGANLAAIPLCVFAFILLCISLIDFETQEIPDPLLIVGATAGILWIAAGAIFARHELLAPQWSDALLGAIAGAGPLFLIDRIAIILLGKEGFGFGDVKLMLMAGLFLGWKLALISLLFAIVAGGAFGAAMMAAKRLERGSYMPFGPFLAVGSLASLWFGPAFISLLTGAT